MIWWRLWETVAGTYHTFLTFPRLIFWSVQPYLCLSLLFCVLAKLNGQKHSCFSSLNGVDCRFHHLKRADYVSCRLLKVTSVSDFPKDRKDTLGCCTQTSFWTWPKIVYKEKETSVAFWKHFKMATEVCVCGSLYSTCMDMFTHLSTSTVCTVMKFWAWTLAAVQNVSVFNVPLRSQRICEVLQFSEPNNHISLFFIHSI